MKLKIPKNAAQIISVLESSGYEAFVVGGGGEVEADG